MNREGAAPNSERPMMRKLIATIALLALVGTSVAIAQRAGSSTNPDKQLLGDAPVSHRQPRADQVPSDKMDPNGIMILKGLTLPPRE